MVSKVKNKGIKSAEKFVKGVREMLI